MKSFLTVGLVIFGTFATEVAESEQPIVRADEDAGLSPIKCDGEWKNITGECSKKCGCGVVKQKFKILTKAENGGAECNTEEGTLRALPCKIRDCPEWSWSACNASCGSGFKKAEWADPELAKELGLELEVKEPRPCTAVPCCEVSEWTDWEGCPACGSGTETRKRTIEVSGYECPKPEELKESRPCKLAECPFTMVIVPNTTCYGETLDLEVDPNIADCLRACEDSSDCKAVVEGSDGKCTFFREVDEQKEEFTPGVSNCYKVLPGEIPEETDGYYDLFLKGSATTVVLYLSWALIAHLQKSGGSLPPSTPLNTPARQHADAPARTPAH